MAGIKKSERSGRPGDNMVDSYSLWTKETP